MKSDERFQERSAKAKSHVNLPINEFRRDKRSNRKTDCGYQNSMYNIKEKIQRDTIERKQEQEEELPIDMIFPQTIDQHADRIDSWRSYNSDLDGREQAQYGCFGACCHTVCCCCNSYNRIRAQYYTWPLWWLLYHAGCCCLCHTSNTGERMTRVKRKLKHLKRRKRNEDLGTMYAMIQLLKQQSNPFEHLENIRINPKLTNAKHDHNMRADLEFYLPQLIAHYLRPDLDPA